MTEVQEGRAAAIQNRVAGFSLVWLAVANLIGLWLAALLLWPELGGLFGSFGYGRWMPLHMDWQLYGWCTLPSLGLIAMRYWKHDDRGGEICGQAFWVWSSILIVGGAGWLLGDATGKPFLNWNGFSRIYFVVALSGIWLLVAYSWWKRQRSEKLVWGLDGVFLAGLGAVPVVMYFVSDATVYPPVNPDSGGATGHSLLLSTLGIVALMGALPGWILNLKRKGQRSGSFAFITFWVLYFVSLGIYMLIQHGHVSNREWDQIFGLGSLMIWPLLVVWLWREYEWSQASRLWQVMFVFWWSALALTGWLTFLPGILDTIKFTNGMVAHAHLAMAGMVTALNMVALCELGKSERVRAVLSRGSLVWLWNGCLLVFVIVLVAQGVREGDQPGRLFLFDDGTELLYAIRFVAGVGLLLCSVAWVLRFWRQGR